MKPFKSIRELKTALETSPQLVEKLKDDPKAFLEQMLKPIDIPYIFLTVIGVVGLTLFTALVLGGILALKEPITAEGPGGEPILLGREIPDFIVMIGSTALGALAGLLVPTDK